MFELLVAFCKRIFMVGVLVISESKASYELLHSVRRILNDEKLPEMKELILRPSFSPTVMKEKIEASLKSFGKRKEVLILSEIYGSSQTNACLSFLKKGKIELVTGYNLTMLIKAATIHDQISLPELVDTLKSTGKKYIQSF